MVATETGTVGKWTVRILLECCLVKVIVSLFQEKKKADRKGSSEKEAEKIMKEAKKKTLKNFNLYVSDSVLIKNKIVQ